MMSPVVKRNKEWWLAMADLEGHSVVDAGLGPFRPKYCQKRSVFTTVLAFGKECIWKILGMRME